MADKSSSNIEDIRWLRDQTGAGVMEAKEALTRAGGDREKAVRVLEQMGKAHAAKKAGRAAENGVVASYIHHDGRIGVLIELNCETDFTARSEPFRELARSIAMQVAVHTPKYTTGADIPDSERAEVMAMLEEDARKNNPGKPDNILPKIAEGMFRKWCEASVLVDQPYIKDPAKSVEQLIHDLVLQVKENIVVKQWSRFQVGA